VFSNTYTFTSTEVTIITLLLFLGATGKSAQIPLYTWLPDAMAGPTPVSALIHAATMVTAGIYMIARSNALYSLSELSQNVVAIVGLATAILAATIALKQYDIKKVLAYSTVSQLGYMFLAMGVGAYSAGVFHVMTHAFFKALLFLAAGSVIHAIGGEQDIRKMGGLNKLKITSITFLVGCIAISGVPPFSGFFSKDEILLAAFEHNKILYAVALFGAMLTAYYMFRLFVITFTGTFRGTEEQKTHMHESPARMTIVLVILAILSVIGGFVNIPAVFMKGGDRLTEFLSPVIPERQTATVSHSTELSLMALSTALVLVAIVIAWFRFRKASSLAESKGLGRILENKWYVDEIYDAIIVKPLNKLGEILNEALEKSGIDALVNGIGKAVQYGGRQLRWLQSGQVGSYVLLMVVSMVLFFVLQFFLRK
jgi:NADH-quinone oxidoreductase subunit L